MISMDIASFQRLCRDENFAITKHAANRLKERGIRLDDIEHAILDGRIIEEYPDDTPFPSCLILGTATSGKPLHLVASTDDEMIYLITSYFPDSDRWGNDFATRKEQRK